MKDRQKYHKGKLLCVEQTSIHKEQKTREKKFTELL